MEVLFPPIKLLSQNLIFIFFILYQRLLWNLKKADICRIRKSLDLVNWENLFRNKNIDTLVSTLDEISFSIFRNFVANETITCHDKYPIWMHKKIKSKIKSKKELYQIYIKNSRNKIDFLNLKNSITEYYELDSASKASTMEICRLS